MSEPINANPTVVDVSNLPTRLKQEQKQDLVSQITRLSLRGPTLDDPPEDPEGEDLIDAQEIFDLISSISDPEHPLTLAQLAVVNLPDIVVLNADKRDDICEVQIKITPTITHCLLATLIGLGIRVRLERALPPRFRIRILIKEGTHQSENQVNKQLNDKERVAAACENEQLLTVISQMLSTCK